MKTYRITELGRQFDLCRSTLLHYDRIGLLSPSSRQDNGYRVYTESDRERLDRICVYRDAGLSLEEITRLLDSPDSQHRTILEDRLQQQREEIRRLQARQRELSRLVQGVVGTAPTTTMDKETWVNILRSSGMDEADMRRWHAEFEQQAPEAHHEFLLSIGIPEREALVIRKNPINLDEERKMDYFYELYEGMPRQGPGSEADLRHALSMLPGLSKHPRVLDIGCGTGAQTVQLARALPGASIKAVDNYAPFLEILQERASSLGYENRIATCEASMMELPFEEGSIDLIWSEGAIYLMGFEKGLTDWKRLLKPGGLVAVTEVTWLVDSPPEEIKVFWDSACPAMTDIASNCAAAENAGYQVIGTFPMPSDTWETEFYRPMEARLAELRKQNAGNAEAIAIYDEHDKEIDLFRRHNAEYGYVFYLLQKAD